MRRAEDLFYDFERDAWIETPGVHARWGERDLLTPAEPPSPGAWVRPPLLFRKEHVFLATIYVAFGVLLFATLTARFFLLPVAAGLIGIVGLFQLVCPSGLPVTKADRRLLEDPDDLDACLINVRINRDRRFVGSDRGVVWFEGGRLLFNGHRTSFALGGEDVLPRSRWHRLQADRPLILPLRVPSGIAVVVFEFALGPLAPGERERRFVERLHAFRQRPPLSRGPRQWPPLER